MNFERLKRAHFVAIGGIGMSALAKFMLNKGVGITGSDISESELVQDLRSKYQIPVYIGSKPQLIDTEIEALIYSPAVPENDPERLRARELNIPEYSYPEALGEISKKMKTVAISGTNGKTTTTSMIIEILKESGYDPSAVVGGVLQKYETNYIAGKSDLFITEACEYKRSFLNIHGDIVLITNITEDHLDYFKDIADIQKAFTQFINQAKPNAVLVCNAQLKNLEPIIQYAKENNIKILDYSKYLSSQYKVSIPGEHNRENMAAALMVCESLGLDIQKASHYLEHSFSGAHRRMEFIGKTKTGSFLYDDYAHNPEGIAYLISALKNHFPKKKIALIFEPHLYSRTEDFKKEFTESLLEVDELFILPTYRAREKHQPEKDFLLSPLLREKKKVFYEINNFHELQENPVFKSFDSETIIVSAGAGPVWKYVHKLKK